MAELLGNPLFTAHDDDGKPISGAKLYFYATGTTTPVDVFQDAGLTTPHASPVVCDSAGRAPDIYLGAQQYKLTIKDALGVAIRTIDPANTLFSAGDITVSLDTGETLTLDQQNELIEVTNLTFIPPAQWADIFSGTSTTDNRPALQKAIDYLHARGGGRLRLMGTTAITPASTTDIILDLYSNIEIVGDTPGAGLKITDDAGTYRGIFGPAADWHDIRLANFTVHQNASGNTTSEIRAGTTAACAAVQFSDFAGKGLTIEGMTFLEAPGVHTISVDSHGTGTDSTDITVQGCRFEFLQGAMEETEASDGFYDNSTIYLSGVRIRALNNTYVNTGDLGDAVTGEELHGRDIESRGSSVTGFRYHALIVSEDTASGLPNNIRYTDFSSTNCHSGPVLYSRTSRHLNGVEVGNGVVHLAASDDFPTMTDPQIGVGFWYLIGGTVDGDLKNINFHDIEIISEPAEDSNLGGASSHVYLEANGNFDNVTVENVRSRNAPNMGLNVYSHGANPQRGVRVRNFTAIDAGNNSTAILRYGVIWRGTAGEGCELVGTRIVDTGSPLNGQHGIDLEFLASGTNLLARDNVAISTQGITPPDIVGSQYAWPVKARTIAVATSIYTLATKDGTELFLLDIASTSGRFIVADVTTNPGGANHRRIRVFIKNSSGGTTNVTWGATFIVDWTDLTSGQSCFMDFEWDYTAAKWIQTAPQLALTV